MNGEKKVFRFRQSSSLLLPYCSRLAKSSQTLLMQFATKETLKEVWEKQSIESKRTIELLSSKIMQLVKKSENNMTSFMLFLQWDLSNSSENLSWQMNLDLYQLTKQHYNILVIQMYLLWEILLQLHVQKQQQQYFLKLLFLFITYFNS